MQVNPLQFVIDIKCRFPNHEHFCDILAVLERSLNLHFSGHLHHSFTSSLTCSHGKRSCPSSLTVSINLFKIHEVLSLLHTVWAASPH
jgi:hypothetical protein